MLDEKFIKILACPETKKPLALAQPDLVDKVNASIERGTVVNKGGEKVTKKIDGGLVWRESPERLYPIRNDTPVLLIDEAIPLRGIS